MGSSNYCLDIFGFLNVHSRAGGAIEGRNDCETCIYKWLLISPLMQNSRLFNGISITRQVAL